jgi:prepilin-type N-terminal cleavage/methylation domain-containing protein
MTKRPARLGFTLVEMLTTVAVLVIVLGLMVSLARDVRTRSADRLTKDLLRRLDTLVAQYKARSLKALPEEERKKYPIVHPLMEGDSADEVRLRENALANNRELVRTLKSQVDLSGTAFSDLSIANFNEVNLLDAWGSPIAYMPHQHPQIGMAAGDRSFFFSAGPDRKYLTRQDNLYSYESGGP